MDSLHQPWKEITKINKWEMIGTSIGGVRTSFYIKDLNILLDAGFQSFNHPTYIFITHIHADHISSLTLTILENINNNLDTNVICPFQSIKFLENMVNSFLKCNYHSEKIPKKVNYIGLNDGDKKDFIFNKRKFQVEAIKSDHTIPTLNYGFIQKTQKLKDEFKNLDGKSIKKLRDENKNIFYEFEKKIFLFCGDTSRKLLENDKIFEYSNIIIECTYFDDSDIDLAEERKHMHWMFLEKKVNLYENINFYLIHLSPKNRDVLIKKNNCFIIK